MSEFTNFVVQPGVFEVRLPKATPGYTVFIRRIEVSEAVFVIPVGEDTIEGSKGMFTMMASSKAFGRLTLICQAAGAWWSVSQAP